MPMYRFMAYNLFWWCHHFGIKNALLPQSLKKKNLEAFFVAPLILDICIDVFWAWVNHKYISNLDIFKEDLVLFAKDGFLTQNL